MGSLKLDGKAIFGIFISAILGVVLLVAIADQVVLNTNTATVTNGTLTAPAINGTLDITGRELITAIEIYNGTNSTQTLIGLGGALRTASVSGGLLSVQFTLNDSAASYSGKPVNVTYTYNPDGYITDASARSITILIILFGALGILIVVLVFLFRGSFGELIKR